MPFRKKIYVFIICFLPLLVFAKNGFQTNAVSLQNWSVKAINADPAVSYLKLIINGKIVRSVNVRRLAEVKDVQTFESTVISAKKVKGKYYILFSYEYPSTWRRGAGYCGAGYEDVVAMICLDEKFKIIHFESYLTNSCLQNVDKIYGYDVAHPEYGIELRKGEDPQ